MVSAKTVKTAESFDFDAWKQLAENDPAAFERQRREVIEAAISEASTGMQQRLQGLQWRIDMERTQCSNPMQSFLTIYKRMWNAVYGENGLVEALNCQVRGHSDDAGGVARTGKILRFDTSRTY